ncbi:CorA family divalent cation transporter [Anaeromicrobium sediminis]|uniref:CorA-like Mg2+ transporter protein n=1 Tax=Anaeromicrobium sediminis TaxID=1478221 RepID=A0A267MK55_9FIRM|nr:CorA family divalent cation transporter [Anaeromicrobium sediminis]PAB59170.1 hypothetical protein CCE28_11670 [Anaeromicrobium sediminis]
MKKEEIKSLHIFMFPFSWKIMNRSKFDLNKESDLKLFMKDLSDKWQYEMHNGDNEDGYNELMYFFDHGKDAMFCRYEPSHKKYAEQMVFNYKYKEKNGKYNICVRKKDEIFKYALSIDKIRLKVYKTGIGIISFYLINKKYSNKEDILKINDYGRRIYPPFLPIDRAKEILLADRIEIQFEKYNIKEEFESVIKNKYKVPSIILKLLGEKFKAQKNLYKGRKVHITPIIDDRMFVICWYGSDELIEKFKMHQRGKYKYEGDLYWYNFIAINNNAPKYQSSKYIRPFIKEHTYDRWIKKGSLYGITENSLVLISNELDKLEEIFLNPWKLIEDLKTIYYDIVCLALAQRASVLKFSNEVATISMMKKDDLIKKISRLYSDYLQFINRMYFREVTPKEQGNEIYSKIEWAMKIEKDIMNLKKEIDEMHEYARLMADQRTNKVLYILTIIGGAFVIPSFFTGYFGMNIYEENLLFWYKNSDVQRWMYYYFLFPAISTLVLIYGILKNKNLINLIFFLIISIFLLKILLI